MTQPLSSPPEDLQPALRRPSARSNKFTPRELAPSRDGDITVLQRNVLRSSAGGTVDRQTARRHVIAGDLPDWEPLPPGELFLSRH